MAANLERLAKQFRKHGYTKEAVVLEAQAAEFRSNAVPEHFSSDQQGQPASESNGSGDQLQNLSALKRRLVEVCATLSMQTNRELLSKEIAEQINQHVGQYLEDDVVLQDLFLRHKASYLNDTQTGTGRTELTINKGFVHAYDYVLTRLIGYGYETVGAIRKTTITELVETPRYETVTYNMDAPYTRSTYRISPRSARFIQIALSRPQRLPKG